MVLIRHGVRHEAINPDGCYYNDSSGGYDSCNWAFDDCSPYTTLAIMLCSSKERLEQIRTAAEQSIVAIIYDGGRTHFDIDKMVSRQILGGMCKKKRPSRFNPALILSTIHTFGRVTWLWESLPVGS